MTEPRVAQAGARVTVVVAHYPRQPNKEPMSSWVLPGHINVERAKTYVLYREDSAVGDPADNEFRDPKYTWYVQHTVVLD